MGEGIKDSLGYIFTQHSGWRGALGDQVTAEEDIREGLFISIYNIMYALERHMITLLNLMIMELGNFVYWINKQVL